MATLNPASAVLRPMQGTHLVHHGSLLRLFIELNKSGTSVVIATHDINLMNQFNARRLVLEEGRLTVYD